MIRAVLFDLDGTLYDRDAAMLALALDRHFWESYSRRCEISDDTWATLRALKTAGKRLGVVTNGQTEWQTRKLEGLGLGSFFDAVLISESEGIRKPDARIFHRALERCRVEHPAEAMFVGDQPEVDVAGAHAAGLVAVWKRVPYWVLAVDGVMVINRLSEIL